MVLFIEQDSSSCRRCLVGRGRMTLIEEAEEELGWSVAVVAAVLVLLDPGAMAARTVEAEVAQIELHTQELEE